ncbi:MAG: alpha/beta hydrolase [Gammaproteobacteria bacterium]|nr:alpha/beta hydrolase [Gammaproteobacteria bacterium]MDH3432850.1 alpha/beta hydrolase [Gammaproteobacteria bacterium]
MRLEIRGVGYAISEWGSPNDPLIVYLHGFADAGSTFQFVVDEFRQNWFVVAPDWRGFGETTSDAPAFWFPDYMADLDCLLQHYSPDAPVWLIGHSMGGNVAGLYAGAMPERVARLVNLEGFGLKDVGPEQAPARYREWIERGRRGVAASHRESFTALAAAIRRRCPGITRAQAGFVARQWATETEDGRVRLCTNPAHKLPNPVLYRRAEAEACWRAVTADVLLVAGRRSEFGSPAELPIQQREIAWIDDAGHMLHFEQPAALARIIEEFLSKPST